jgi:hypothetical protein
MRPFDIKKFEENRDKQGYINEYHFKLDDGTTIRQLDITSNATNNEKTYQEIITKEFSPIKYVYNYYENGSEKNYRSIINDSGIEIKEYDKNGNLIKETNFNQDFKYTFEQIHDIVLKEKGVDIYDTRQAVALRHNTPDAIIKKYYQIHVLKSELVQGEWYYQPDYSFLIDDTTGKILTQEEIDNKKTSSSIYKTYKGKDYTKDEWVVFEQEQYNEHLRKTGRADLIKPIETPQTENKKSSFLADEEDVKPKKKGFWG